jgi:spindle assembly abnormal protein 6
LDIGENDFHHLKRDQAILVDFPIFPSKLIELIDLCQGSSTSTVRPPHSLYSEASAVSSPAAQFSARLDTGTGIFSIVESNVFKQLTHISLQLRPGNDQAIKAYLSARLSMATEISKQQAQQIRNLSKELQFEKESRQVLAQELHDLRAYQTAQLDALRSQHEHELSRLQVQSFEAKEQTQRQYEEKYDTLQAQFTRYQQQAERKLKDLEDVNAGKLRSIRIF